MDQFIRIPGITRAELKQANAVRLHLRILTIADIADPSGEFIPDGMLTGKWQAGSDLYWPYQPCPPAEFWATFRRCLRLTFCTGTSPHQPIDNGMDLDTHLGDWLPVKRYTWFDAYRSESTIYWRDDDVIYEMVPSMHRGMYSRGPSVREVPLDAHPISVQQVGNRLWTHRPYKMGAANSSVHDPVGYTVRDTLSAPCTLLIVCSDASTRIDTGITTCAWVISATPTQKRTMCAHIQNISSSTSYRGELEGIYRALRSTLALQPNQVQMWCDNKAALDKAQPHRTTPGMMIQSDGDIILAIQALVTQFPGQISFHHVYGHQDTRHREGRNKQRDLPTPALLNIECDQVANETSVAVSARESHLPTLQPPYPGSKALLRINGKWITTKLKEEINRACHRDDLWEYCKTKHHWTEETMSSILWSALQKARAGRTFASMVHTSKLLHGWLPVMHVHGRVTGSTQCPGCEETDETIDHMLSCPHERMETVRHQAIINVREQGIKQGLPAGFMTCVQQYLRYVLLNQSDDLDPDLNRIRVSQHAIGPMMFVRGYLSIEWLKLLRSLIGQHAERKLARLIRILWDYLIAPLWATRNDILHRHSNYVSENTHAQLGDRLIWYTRHREELDIRDQFLARHTLAQIEAMTTSQRREWVRHLDTARTAWAKERNTIASGQRLITQYFQRRDNE
jgi:ribonuclease HI